MTKRFTLRILPLALLFMGLLSAPLFARGSHRHHHHGHRHYSHGHHHHHHYRGHYHNRYYRGGYYRYPTVGVGIYAAPYAYDPYYYRPAYSRTVVYTAPRYTTGRTVVVSTGRSVQAELARRGYYGGRIDGVVGSQTRAAIRTYQVDRGLPVTGRIDTPLLRSLGLV